MLDPGTSTRSESSIKVGRDRVVLEPNLAIDETLGWIHDYNHDKPTP